MRFLVLRPERFQPYCDRWIAIVLSAVAFAVIYTGVG